MMTATKEEIIELLLKGTDERTTLNSKGLSNYGIDFSDDSLTNRGSCTCNLITNDHIDFLADKIGGVSTEQGWINLVSEVENGIKLEISGTTETDYEVFFGPSGTDVVYFPLLFSRELYPEKEILNIVTCIEELGSGTINAGQGKYFSGANQFGNATIKGESIIDPNFVKTEYLRARCAEGTIEDPKNNLRNLIESNPDKSIIVSLVVGSKSGIEDNLSWIGELDADNVLWNVDMCQFRHSRELIESLTNNGVSVMITGSKFYQAPPFCGAILIPERWINKIEKLNELRHFNLFNKVFSRYDIPEKLRSKTNLPSEINKGGVCRWLVTIKSIYDLRRIGQENIQKVISNWNSFVNRELGKYDEFILMPDQSKTNPTIISFQVKGKNGRLNHQKMRSLFFSMVEADHTGLPTKRFFIGQPVAYGDKSFLRLAIGANNIVNIHKRGGDTFEIEKRIIAVIQQKLIEFESNQ
tara:strand:- start:2100 stop:3506 length:1407 start_codon:yes stop_codon:yes gene_type:complete